MTSVRWTRAEAEQAAADALAALDSDHQVCGLCIRNARAVLDALGLTDTFTVTDGRLEQVGEWCTRLELVTFRDAGACDAAHEPVYRVVPS